MPVARIDAGDLYYEVAGEGPPLLLIAGFSGNTTGWLPVLPALAEHFTLIMFDNRGAGRSCVPPGPYTTAQMADDAVALLDHLDVNRAHVLGSSMGGMIAQELALRHPARVDKLILNVTAARPTPVLTRFLEANIWAIKHGMPPEDRAFWVLPWMASPAIMTAHEKVMQTLAVRQANPYPAPDAGLIAQAQAILAHDALARVGQITAPTLVLSAAEDILTPVAGGRVLAEAIPGSEFQVLPRGAHVTAAEYPAEVSSAMLAFLLA
ncbi:MAG: alpha/beta hydrolase [Chloroflexota bacterium]|nr:alpha/beta hydrolase [Chloroflexota bacterium]